MTSPTSTDTEALKGRLRALKLPAMAAAFATLAATAEGEGWSFVRYLDYLAVLEVEERKQRRTERLMKGSGLPADKTLETLDLTLLSTSVRRQIPTLCEGGFVNRAENILAFGLPGRGKTHTVCAIATELVRRGYKVLFLPVFRLVQRLLVAKRALTLERELRHLDTYDAIVIDSCEAPGYVE